jgi:hypothetical protein
MNYKVHHFPISMKKDRERLEAFLNSLQGEVISIIPNLEKTTLTQIYGIAEKIDFLLIVEGVKPAKQEASILTRQLVSG